jgi:hypothetical protein
MPKAAFLIPASPTRAFLAQIAAFSLALSRLDWHRWEPSLHVCMGGEPDTAAFRDWLPHLRDVATLFVPASVSENTPWYYAQIDGLYRWAPRDADVMVRMDADTLPVGGIEDLLDYVAETRAIAGVIAHFKFPAWAGTTSREAWLRVARGLISRPLHFGHAYSLTDAALPEDDRVTPFYLNDGVVFFPRATFPWFRECYSSLRPRLMDRLPDPYYSGQIALTLAVSEIDARTCALPMRYNFPNDDLAAARYPEELEHVKIFHYLRTEAFDRQHIFLDSEGYRGFLQARLAGANEMFQRHVKNLFGEEYPFADPASGATRPTRSGHGRALDPLSYRAYEAALAAHARDIAPALQQLDSAVASLEEDCVLATVRPAANEAAGHAPSQALSGTIRGKGTTSGNMKVRTK